MPLELIGAGLGRTGTFSLMTALNELGLPCHHMLSLFQDNEQAPLFNDALQGKNIDWHYLFRNYKAAVDYPCAFFYIELMKEFPYAKVLLSVRDPEKWYESTYKSIFKLSNMRWEFPYVISYLLIFHLTSIRDKLDSVEGIIWKGTFGGRFANKKHAIEVFNDHNEEVKRLVPAERLLVYDVKEGWEPLCKFLGKPIPNKPFPHVNDSANIEKIASLIRYGTYALLLVLLVVFAYFCLS